MKKAPFLVLALALVPALFVVFRARRPSLAEPAEFLPTLAARSAKSTACGSRYEALFGKGIVDIRIVFGYKDARPARFVGDRYEKTLLVSYLVAPCRPGLTNACGFQRDEEDADIFTREIIGPAGHKRRVRLTIASSAAGPDDDENRQDPFQKWRSRHAEALFLRGLGVANVVLYDGHSRDGGGPDFRPPRLGWGQHVDYPWYATKRPGVAMLRKGLRREESSPKQLLGILSCASDRHFVAALRREQPRLALITSRQVLYWADALRGALGTVSALLGQWCPPEFDAALKATSTGGTIHVTGLFD